MTLKCTQGLTHWSLEDINVLLKYISVFDILSISSETALGRMPPDGTDDKSTVVQAMAWCHQTTGHYLKQCWPCFMTLSGITRGQWVNSLVPGKRGIIILHLVIFKLIPRRDILAIACEITLGWMSQDLTDNLVNNCSGNGLVPWGNKPSAEPMLTHIYVSICSHYATMRLYVAAVKQINTNSLYSRQQ